MSVAGAYWRGDEKRKQLVRLYGITFPKKKMLDEYLALLEEAKKRDHRKLGKELNCSPSLRQLDGITFVVAPWNAIAYATGRLPETSSGSITVT